MSEKLCLTCGRTSKSPFCYSCTKTRNAAPALLEVLSQIVQDYDDGEPSKDIMRSNLKDARAAIAQAEPDGEATP